ncbi:MAG: hypothetical protein IH600_16380 [Bacteroidetes bacterium]|nr:hypothetical protein [Bacteroidota bacterium]
MMKSHLLILAVLLLAAASPATAQQPPPSPYESDILAARPIRYWFGLGPGGYYFKHQGSFSPACNCEFRDQDGGRFTMAGEFRVQYPKLGFAWGVLVSYFDASTEFVRESTRPSIVVGGNSDVEVDYRNTSDVHLRWVSINPGFFWYFPRTQMFLRAGVEFGIPLENRYNHVERILTDGLTYYDGNTEHTLLAESDIPGGDRLRLAVTAGLGYDFFVTPSIAITPRAGLAIPLSTVSSVDSDWSVLTAYGFLMLNLRL